MSIGRADSVSCMRIWGRPRFSVLRAVLLSASLAMVFGCAPTIGENFRARALDRAAFEMKCPKDQIELVPLDFPLDRRGDETDERNHDRGDRGRAGLFAAGEGRPAKKTEDQTRQAIDESCWRVEIGASEDVDETQGRGCANRLARAGRVSSCQLHCIPTRVVCCLERNSPWSWDR
jgi:hypothetical protein